jgi:hypothetical protein
VTPEERAEKVRGIIARWALSSSRIEDPELLVKIAAQIAEAEREAVAEREHENDIVLDETVKLVRAQAFDDGYKTGYGDRHESVERIRKAALMEAAKIADLLPGDNGKQAAKAIRARAKEVTR